MISNGRRWWSGKRDQKTEKKDAQAQAQKADGKNPSSKKEKVMNTICRAPSPKNTAHKN